MTSDRAAHPSRLRRRVLRSAAGLLAAVLTTSLAPASAAPAQDADPFPDVIELPSGFQPEGIASGRGATAFLGQRSTGEIYRLNLRTGNGRILSEGTGAPALGMKVDRRGRLWVAGGTSGTGYVVDTRTGRVLASYDLTDADSTFINDVTLARGAAWFTDSVNAAITRVPLGKRLPDQREVDVLPLSGEWTQDPAGLNANGISRTPDREALLVVNLTTGDLYRVDPVTGDARVVDLGGYSLANGDGLLLVGRTLYAAKNRDNLVAALRLSADGSRGRLVREIRSYDFDVPTTIARFGKRLYLPNARFTSPDATDFSVVQVRR